MLNSEVRKLVLSLPLLGIVLVSSLGLLAVLHGVGWYLLFIFLGVLIGFFVLDLDKILAKYLETKEDLFHTFGVYVLIFVMAVFVMTASSSMIGKGIILGMMVNGAQYFTEVTKKWVAFGLIGLILIFLLFL